MLIQSSPHPWLQLSKDDKLLYRGEGNSNLVIAIKNERKVIRFLKADAKQWKNVEKDDIYSILNSHISFNENVIPNIITDSFHTCPTLIKLNESQMETINQLVRDKRPSFRLDKSIVDSRGHTLALLLPDYCCLPKTILRKGFKTKGPVIGVEIKPKQGFLPNAELLSDALTVKSCTCRYGMAQFYKLNRGTIGRLSNYCPLDLFSGCPTRMQTSLSALIDNPQNNLRVFRDIQLAFGQDTNQCLEQVLQDFIPDSKERTKILCQLLVSALTKQYNRSQLSEVKHQNQFCSLHNNRCECDSTIDHCLPFGCVLDVVLSAQKLDTIDSEVAKELLDLIDDQNNNTIESSPPCGGHPKTQFDSSKSPGCCDHFTTRGTNNNNNNTIEFETELSSQRLSGETNQDFFKRKLGRFLVSLTAKDCSIMIAMQRLDQINEDFIDKKHLIVLNGNQYLFSISITDLDPKPLHKINKTLSKDQRMVKEYNQR